jgi:hypothetical protein
MVEEEEGEICLHQQGVEEEEEEEEARLSH